MIEALREFHLYYGSSLTVELPRWSGHQATLLEAAAEIAGRLTRIFLRDSSGQRPVLGGPGLFQSDPHWRDHIPFYEYFHGDNGSGLGASHQDRMDRPDRRAHRAGPRSGPCRGRMTSTVRRPSIVSTPLCPASANWGSSRARLEVAGRSRNGSMIQWISENEYFQGEG